MTDKLYNNLRQHQEISIKKTIDNNYESGVHFHATGTGKSWIALEIILEYNKRYPSNNIIWLCEQKSILIEQLSRSTSVSYTHLTLPTILLV